MIIDFRTSDVKAADLFELVGYRTPAVIHRIRTGPLVDERVVPLRGRKGIRSSHSFHFYNKDDKAIRQQFVLAYNECLIYLVRHLGTSQLIAPGDVVWSMIEQDILDFQVSAFIAPFYLPCKFNCRWHELSSEQEAIEAYNAMAYWKLKRSVNQYTYLGRTFSFVPESDCLTHVAESFLYHE